MVHALRIGQDKLVSHFCAMHLAASFGCQLTLADWANLKWGLAHPETANAGKASFIVVAPLQIAQTGRAR